MASHSALTLTRVDRALAGSAISTAQRCRAHSVRLSLSGAGGALDAVLYAKPLEISTRSNYAQSTVQPDKLSRRERQLQDLVSKILT